MAATERPIRVLILCTRNSARSQMAEGILRHLNGDRFQVQSAGTEVTRVHPLAVRAMAAIGIDISGARSKHLSDLIDEHFDYVITVCDQAAESCPVFPGRPLRVHWSFVDPSSAEGGEAERYQAFECVRDEIMQRLRTWSELQLTRIPGGDTT